MSPDPVGVPFEKEGVRGFLHRPESDGERGLVLTHGAGSNCNAPILWAVAARFCAAGVSAPMRSPVSTEAQIRTTVSGHGGG
jgi:predicted alpha/beta-hydrolase family hydrolase